MARRAQESSVYARPCQPICCKKGVTELSGKDDKHALPSNPSFVNINMQPPLNPWRRPKLHPLHARGNMQPGGGGARVQAADSCVVAYGLATCHGQVTKTPTTQPMQPCAMRSKHLAFGKTGTEGDEGQSLLALKSSKAWRRKHPWHWQTCTPRSPAGTMGGQACSA